MPLGPPPDFINEDDEFFKLENSEKAKIEKEKYSLLT